MAQDDASPLDRISLQDWALAVIGGVLTLGGLLIIPRNFNTGIVTLVFFGLCFTHAVSVILRKRRALRQVAMTASVSGGVPVRQSRARMGLLTGALLAVGITHVAFTSKAIQVGLGWLLVAVGAVMLLGLVSGLLCTSYIQFDPAALTFGDRHGKAVVPWGAITGLARADMHNNPVVLARVDLDAVEVQPATHRPRLLKQIGRSRGSFGADFAIMSTVYGIDAPVLLAALQRYASEPAARRELERRLPLAR